MKKTLLLLATAIFSLVAQAQTKSTGNISLTAGMTAKLDLDNTITTATLTLTGPSDRWFSLQFGSFAAGSGMGVGQDLVYYNGTTLIDAVLNGIGAAPTTDTNDWTVISNTVAAGTRTIVATRPFSTPGEGDYTFIYEDNTIDFAFAKMSSASFALAYHGSGGNRGYSLNVALSPVLGTDNFEQDKVAFYPNPASSSFSIQASSEIKSAKIYDATGKQVHVISFEKEKTVDISGLQNGIYYVEIESANHKIQIEKIVKNSL